MVWFLQNKDKKGFWESTGISFSKSKKKSRAHVRRLVRTGYLPKGEYKFKAGKKQPK